MLANAGRCLSVDNCQAGSAVDNSIPYGGLPMGLDLTNESGHN